MPGQTVAIVLALLEILVVETVVTDSKPTPSPRNDRPIVMGFATEGERKAELPWSILTDVVCFSVELEEKGGIHNGCGWPWTELVKKADQNDVRTSLCVSASKMRFIEPLVAKEDHRATFFGKVVEMMRKGGVIGLSIDFEDLESTGWIHHMPDFMKALTRHVHKAIPGSFVTVCTPPHSQGGIWDFDALSRSCDAIFIMGYDYHGAWSKRAGPSAPLTGQGMNLTQALQGPYGKVVRDNPQKIILGMPLYGNEWITSSDSPKARMIKHVGTIAIRNIQRDESKWKSHWSAESQCPYWTFRKEGSERMIWGENSRSIGLKVDLAMRHHLRGVGVWRLGFAGPHNDVWKTIHKAVAGGRPPENEGHSSSENHE